MLLEGPSRTCFFYCSSQSLEPALISLFVLLENCNLKLNWQQISSHYALKDQMFLPDHMHLNRISCSWRNKTVPQHYAPPCLTGWSFPPTSEAASMRPHSSIFSDQTPPKLICHYNLTLIKRLNSHWFFNWCVSMSVSAPYIVWSSLLESFFSMCMWTSLRHRQTNRCTTWLRKTNSRYTVS